MIKVCYVVSTLRKCGPINVLFNIIDNLDRHKFEPTIITLSPEPINSDYKAFENKGIEVISLNLSRLSGLFLGRKKLSEVISMVRPDIVHSHGFRPDLLVKDLNTDYFKVTTLHSYPYFDYPSKFGKLKGELMASRHLASLNKFNKPVACSEGLSKSIEAHGVNLEFVRNGVNTKRYFNVNEDQKKELRKKLNLPLNKKIFISVGALIPLKDPLTLINGFFKSEQSKESILIMLGDGELLDKCKKMEGKHRGLKCYGNVNNVSEFLQASDYFISASHSEGLPNAVLEALACGNPVCLSNICPHQEILSLNNKAGILFEVGEENSLSHAIDQIVGNKYTDYEATQVIQEHLSSEKMAKNYEDIYKNRMIIKNAVL